MNYKAKLNFSKHLPFESQNPIAILATGPSLLKTYNESLRSKYSYIIGVNVAVDHFVCDYWVFADPLSFKRATPKGNPKLCIGKKVLDDPICKEAIEKLSYTIAENERPKECPSFIFSIEIALIVASKLQSNDLTFYGVDRDGQDDCNGDKSGWRDKRRWFSEKSRWSYFTNWYKNQSSSLVKFKYIKI